MPNKPTDKEMLDWLSDIHCASFKRHYEARKDRWTPEEERTCGCNGNVDFFSVESQHLSNIPTLREAIALAMRKTSDNQDR